MDRVTVIPVQYARPDPRSAASIMNILATGTYNLDIIGDGITDEMELPLAALRTPAPFVEGQQPIGIYAIRQPPNTEYTFANGVLHLKFGIPPSASKLIIEAIFGKDTGMGSG